MLVCLGISVLVDPKLLRIDNLSNPLDSMISRWFQFNDAPFVPSLVSLDKSVSQPDERQKLQQRLFSKHQESRHPLKVFAIPFHLPSSVYGEGSITYKMVFFDHRIWSSFRTFLTRPLPTSGLPSSASATDPNIGATCWRNFMPKPHPPVVLDLLYS
jgi:hypothetical protein